MSIGFCVTDTPRSLVIAIGTSHSGSMVWRSTSAMPPRLNEGPMVIGDCIMDNSTVVILGTEHVLLLERKRVDLDDRRSGVWPVLRQRSPEIATIIINPTSVILDISRLGQSGIGNESALTVVDERVRETCAGSTVGAIDRLRVFRGRDSPLSGRNEVAVVADTGHTFWFASIAFELGL
ncbi:uncharacterized protein N7458_003006 [Penicillium daleae]|uniref:Uncharacterized protein n=1 Tax=Penicillium daleae TaxID=63821 RepID=A0AAD6G6F7_9EURO|nr:uncharacterized protein N7458_003006 [Penicillium daleae]KAJ5461454.1 hypothetical protein N7458_003006 [Penicillium daleae]